MMLLPLLLQLDHDRLASRGRHYCVPSSAKNTGPFYSLRREHRLNMELDLQSLFGLHVTWCAQIYSLADTQQPGPPFSPHLDS